MILIMNVALRIAILRTVRTQTMLAFRTGIPEGRISKIVNEWQTPDAHERRVIAEAVGEPADALFASQIPEPPRAP
jgi:hypothetical protein